MRFLKSNDGHDVYDSDFFTNIDLYKKTGLFPFLAQAFLICREKNYAFTEELLEAITTHFKEFVDANEQVEGLRAFGFDNNKKVAGHQGGAWQGKAAKAKAIQGEIMGLAEDFEALTSNTKKDIFKQVALALGTTSKRIKTLYYKK